MKPFQLIFNYARRYTASLVVTALSMLALVGIQLLIPWIIKLLIARITDPGTTLANYELRHHPDIDRAGGLPRAGRADFRPLVPGPRGRLGRGGGCARIHLRTHAAPVACVSTRTSRSAT